MPHINEKIDFTIAAFIVYTDERSSSVGQSKVLLIDHKTLKKWLPIGGHIELDEDPEQALIREIKEECGLDVEIIADKPEIVSPGTKFLPTPAYLDIHDISDSHKHVGFIYFAKAKTDKVTLAEDEHNNIRWFTEKEINDPKYSISPAIKFYASKGLESVR